MTPPSMAAGSDSPAARTSREERRLRTEASILDAARTMFAEVGFERTTIRGVASRAAVDPALVMQYFGSKEGLFAAAARAFADRKRSLTADRDDIPSAALSDLFAGFENPREAAASIAVIRSCLTHERARDVMRDEIMMERHQALAGTIGGADAELRAGLFAAVMLGTTIARYLVEIPSVTNASREEIERVLEPVLRCLVDP